MVAVSYPLDNVPWKSLFDGRMEFWDICRGTKKVELGGSIIGVEQKVGVEGVSVCSCRVGSFHLDGGRDVKARLESVQYTFTSRS